jgi:hypothetical protein
MEKDAHTTDVVFRFDKTYGVFALFPHEVHDNISGSVTCYAHVGQHSAANYDGCIKSTRPATESEYQDLFKELESIGYNLKVVQRQNYSKWLKAYKEGRRISLGYKY